MSAMLQMFDSWSAVWAAGLWRASLEGSAAITVVWLVARFCKFLSPRIICWMWRLVCVKLLVSLISIQPISIAVLRPKVPAEMDAGLSSPTEPAKVALEAGELVGQRVGADVARPEAADWHVETRTIVAAVWLAGGLCCMLLTAREWLLVRRLRRTATPAWDDSLLEMLRHESERLRIMRVPQICQSPSIESPLLAGIWRPMVVLPADASDRFDNLELRLMLAHELAHLKRRDLVWNWLPTVAWWLLFFHPLVWLLRRSWLEAQETACDELLVQCKSARPSEYGRLLLRLTQCGPRPRFGLAAAGVLGAYQNLERRIVIMTRVFPISRNRLLAAGAILTIAAALGIVPWRLVAQEPAKSTTTSAADPADPTKLSGKIYVWAWLEGTTEFGAPGEYRGFIAIDPNTGNWAKLGNLGHSLRLSPDGTQLAFDNSPRSRLPRADGPAPDDVFYAELKDLNPMCIVQDGTLPIWSPDGKRVLYHVGKMTEAEGWRGKTWVIDMSGKAEKLPIPETDEVDDWSQQGNWLVTVSDRHPPLGSGYQLYVMHPDGTDEKRITQGGGLNCYPRFSPDGRRIVYVHQRHLNSVWTVDTDGSNPKQILIGNEDGTNAPDGACWSPDGKWLAALKFDWSVETRDGKKTFILGAGDGNYRIEIVSPDGTSRGVLKLKDVAKIRFFEHPDWK